MHGPSPSRTCFMGNGRTFHATFSRLPAFPVGRIASTTGSCASRRFGRRVEPATAVAVAATKCLRENLLDKVTTPPTQKLLYGYCIHYSHAADCAIHWRFCG